MNRENTKQSRTARLTTTAVMAALIFVVTWLIKIPVPVSGGAYLNFGDSVIYMCAYILGGPLGAACAGVGSALADLAGGAAVYALPTLAIKALMALVAGAITKKQTFGRYAIACVTGGAIMVAGYYGFELAFFGTVYATTSLPFNLIQWVGSVLVALALYQAVKRISVHYGFRRTSVGEEALSNR